MYRIISGITHECDRQTDRQTDGRADIVLANAALHYVVLKATK